MDELLQIEGISKSFSGVSVLNKVDFTVRAGSVVALVGENGAGKSTLMRIISGIYRRDTGSIRIRGEDVVFSNPREAMDSGIAIIHQELNLIAELSVAENIFLGREPLNTLGFVKGASMIVDAREVLARLNLEIDPAIKLGELSIAQQQMVEIAKALSVKTDVIIMDEPTAALTESETETLFSVVRDLRRGGKGVVFISHRLDEIFRLCDDVAVLRDGEMVYRAVVSVVDEDTLIHHMVGRELSERYPFTSVRPGAVRLDVRNLCARGVSDITFEARAGEVVGFAGLMGAGRTELAKALFGANPIVSEQIAIDGKARFIRSPRDGARAGIGFVSEDRKHEGLISSCPPS